MTEVEAVEALQDIAHWLYVLALAVTCVALTLIIMNWTLQDIDTRVSLFGLALRLNRPRDASGAPANPATIRTQTPAEPQEPIVTHPVDPESTAVLRDAAKVNE